MTFEDIPSDADIVEMIHATERTARKDHRCSHCGGIIPAGTRYWDRTVMTDSTKFYRDRFHEKCPKVAPSKEGGDP